MKWTDVREWLALSVVLLIGLALRLYRLGEQSLFFDEAWSWAAAMRLLLALGEQDIVFADPPLESLLVNNYLGNTYPTYGVGLNQKSEWQAIKIAPTSLLCSPFSQNKLV